MKTIFFYIGLIAFFAISSCSAPKVLMNGDVEYVSMLNDVLTFKCKGSGASKKEADYNAKVNAFKILFFRGVPGSSNSAPMISVNEVEELKKNKIYFDDFFSMRYLSFITASSLVNSYNAKEKSTVVLISINVRALKQDLVSKKIVSDYGF